MAYVQGFVAAVPNENREDFIKHAKLVGNFLKGQGALEVVDTWGADVPDGEVTSFPMAVKCQAGETVSFGWIIWPSKEVADAGMGAMMTDEAMQEMGHMPFDGKRMIFGGFDVVNHIKDHT